MQARKAELQAERDEASSDLAEARAELSGVQREWEALKRDREARERAMSKRSGRQQAIDGVRAAKGYERAVAAALGRDGKALLGVPEGDAEGRYWTGADAPSPVEDSLSAHVESCPAELRALLALVHVAQEDDERALQPGHALVTMAGQLRRWDGLVVRGEGSAEAARLAIVSSLLPVLLPAQPFVFLVLLVLLAIVLVNPFERNLKSRMCAVAFRLHLRVGPRHPPGSIGISRDP